MTIKTKILFTFYFLLFTLFVAYSYAFLDVNLTLTSFKPYLNFQLFIRQFGNSNRQISAIIFSVISFLLFTFYYLLFKETKKDELPLKAIIILGSLISILLVFSYPAFSSDIFNYIFNAKIFLTYHANPHIHTAWEFKDPMLYFMRNVHTPAPYFYGWTILSLIPYIVGLGRIFPEIISFKFFSVVLFFLTFIVLKKILNKLKYSEANQRLTLFLLNPLILIEAIGVGHNDFSMMLPALISFYFLVLFKEQKKIKFLSYCLLLIALSVSTKYATIVLLPLFLIWYYRRNFDLGMWGAILLFLLFFVRPLDQLHSWYLLWPLTWIFLAKNIKWAYFFCFLSFFALLRYTPYIWYGNWDPPVNQLRLGIYFIIPGVFIIYKLIKTKFFFNKTR